MKLLHAFPARGFLLLATGWLAACVFETGLAGGTGSTTESGVVSGRILDSDGVVPAAGATVTLIPEDQVPPISRPQPAPRFQTKTDAGGYYRLERVEAGRYNLLAAKDSLRSFRSALELGKAEIHLGNDTVRSSGSLAGIVELQPGDDPRTVLILVLGTHAYTVPADGSGSFTLFGMAEGEYRVRFLSTIQEYAPLDTLLRIRSGKSDTLPDPIRPPYAGIPVIENFAAAWDTLSRTARLHWSKSKSPMVTGYYVYRSLQGTPLGPNPLHPHPISDTVYADANLVGGARYVYAVKAVDGNGNVGKTFSRPDTLAIPAD